MNKFPARRLFGLTEAMAINRLFLKSWLKGQDFGFQQEQEKYFCKEFSDYHGGNFYVDAVNSGTNAIWIALKAYGIKKNDGVIISPATNPGSIMPVAILTNNISIADSATDNFNVSTKDFEEKIDKNIRFAVLTHSGGRTFSADKIKEICSRNGIVLIEDCSQAPGAEIEGRKVGTFGDVSIWSTMYSKTISTGGCGGVIMTREKEIYDKIRMLADRGKNFADPEFNFRRTDLYKLASLNFNQDEISCLIGRKTLRRLDKTIAKRIKFLECLKKYLEQECKHFRLEHQRKSEKTSPFFAVIHISEELVQRKGKEQIVMEITKSGININGDYRDIPAEWPWLREIMVNKNQKTVNASLLRDRTFNLLFNERFTSKHAELVARKLKKIELKG